MDNTPRKVWLKDAEGNLIDEAMACRERRGLLLTCHGGPAVRRAVDAELSAAGFKQTNVEPFGDGTFARRTLSLLAAAQGMAAVTLVLEAAGQLEVLRRIVKTPAELPGLLAQSGAARFLFLPPRVQLWGPVNAGKSSLLNALCGGDLAAVGDEPGLTRDVIEGRFEHEGFVVRLFDAPGVWAGGGALDAEAQKLADTWRREADLTLVLHPDSSPAPTTGRSEWAIRSHADEPQADGVSIHRPETLNALKSRLVEHFFGELRRLPPERRFALHQHLREDLAKGAEAARGWLD